jgi:hypothetical protein
MGLHTTQASGDIEVPSLKSRNLMTVKTNRNKVVMYGTAGPALWCRHGTMGEFTSATRILQRRSSPIGLISRIVSGFGPFQKRRDDCVGARVTEPMKKAGLNGVPAFSSAHASEFLGMGVPIATTGKRLGHANERFSRVRQPRENVSLQNERSRRAQRCHRPRHLVRPEHTPPK